MEKYTLKVLKPEYWKPLHDNLVYTSDGNNYIPRRGVECCDSMNHSPTRGTFKLTKEVIKISLLDLKLPWPLK